MKYCINCGDKIEGGDVFCENCGQKITASAVATSASPIILEEEKVEHNVSKPFYKKRWFFITIAVCVALSVALAVVHSIFPTSTDWQEFTSPDGKFKTSFPVYPTHTNQTIETTNTELYRANQFDGTITYDVIYLILPYLYDVSNPENSLKTALDGGLKDKGGTLISSSISDFGIYKSIDYLTYIADRELYNKGKIILVDHTLYNINVWYQTQNSANMQYDKFINSFQLLQNQTPINTHVAIPKYKDGSYYVLFSQIGGPSGSRTAQVSATPTNGGNGIVGLTPIENYVSFYINIPADHVWVGCKDSDFYTIDSTNNSGNQITGTEKTPTGLIFGIGINLEDQQQNSVNFVCVRN